MCCIWVDCDSLVRSITPYADERSRIRALPYDRTQYDGDLLSTDQSSTGSCRKVQTARPFPSCTFVLYSSFLPVLCSIVHLPRASLWWPRIGRGKSSLKASFLLVVVLFGVFFSFFKGGPGPMGPVCVSVRRWDPAKKKSLTAGQPSRPRVQDPVLRMQDPTVGRFAGEARGRAGREGKAGRSCLDKRTLLASFANKI